MTNINIQPIVIASIKYKNFLCSPYCSSHYGKNDKGSLMQCYSNNFHS